MAAEGYKPGFPFPADGKGPQPGGGYAPHRRFALHIGLFAITLVFASASGARLAENFHLNLPAFRVDRDLLAIRQVWSDPLSLISGLPFALTLLAILLAHECGHYLACRYYGIDASLPYFIPVPTFLGTLGAFIRIRSPIYSKRALFDVGIAGPLAGFVFLVPALGIGLAYSKVIVGIAHQGDLIFGVPPLLWLAEKAVFPGVSSADIYLHPVARAAWAGIFATALNLLPIGQLDGGHVVYAFAGERHRTISKIVALALVPLVVFWPYWLVWALVLLLFGLRHPSIFDATPLGGGRRRLGWVALAMFLLCFMAAPVSAPDIP